MRLVGEDIIREAGYMLPQSGNAHNLLASWAVNPPAEGFPLDAVWKLMELVPCNDKKKKGESNMKTYKCKVCGHVFSVSEGETPVCPVCKATGDKLELAEEPKPNRYAGTQTEKNLEAAFAGESQARNKYTYFASVAKKEGYEQIAALFTKTAEN